MATEHFCTLFDLGYLPQGMALRESLERHVKDFVLWVLCMDVEVEDALRKLDLPSVRVIPLRDIESPELLAVKSGRSRGEYCWTMSPFLPRFILDRHPSVERVTYLDSDILLVNRPTPIFQEFEQSGKHVLYTEHGYASEYDQALQCGRYCVQLLIYKNSLEARRVLDWWGARCLEWCFARQENGLFGDQRYLESWEELFPDETHLLQRLELTAAPWNAIRFPVCSAVLFHFHGFRIYQGERIRFCEMYKLPQATIFSAYCRYASCLRRMLQRMAAAGVGGRFSKEPRMTMRQVSFWLRGRYRGGSLAAMAERYERIMPVDS